MLTGPYTAMRMCNVTILKFHDGWQLKWIFCLKIVPFQINLNIICLRKNCEEFPKNLLIVILFCCVLQQTWRLFGPGVWCLFVNFSRHFRHMDSVEGKERKTSRFCVIEREYSNKLYEMGCFPIKPTHITKTIIWPNIRPPTLYKFSSLIQDLGCG